MNPSAGTIFALYYGVYTILYLYLTHQEKLQIKHTKTIKLLVAISAILFVTLFPYWLENLAIKTFLTIVGFYTGINIIDLIFLDPPSRKLSFRDYVFCLSTSTRPPPQNESKASSTLHPHFNHIVLRRLTKIVVKSITFLVVFGWLQQLNYANKSYVEYFLLLYLLGGCIYFALMIILDVVALLWEFTFNMTPKILFNDPILATSPRDFWSRRWNMFFRDFFHKLFFKNKALSYLRVSLYAAAIFVISGLLHEYVYWSIMGEFSGHYLAFFIVHGIATNVQVVFQVIFPVLRRAIPRPVGIVLNNVILALTIPIFVGPYIEAGFLQNARLPFYVVPGATISRVLNYH